VRGLLRAIAARRREVSRGAAGATRCEERRVSVPGLIWITAALLEFVLLIKGNSRYG